MFRAAPIVLVASALTSFGWSRQQLHDSAAPGALAQLLFEWSCVCLTEGPVCPQLPVTNTAVLIVTNYTAARSKKLSSPRPAACLLLLLLQLACCCCCLPAVVVACLLLLLAYCCCCLPVVAVGSRCSQRVLPRRNHSYEFTVHVSTATKAAVAAAVTIVAVNVEPPTVTIRSGLSAQVLESTRSVRHLTSVVHVLASLPAGAETLLRSQQQDRHPRFRHSRDVQGLLMGVGRPRVRRRQ